MTGSVTDPEYGRFYKRKSKRLRPLRRALQTALVRMIVALTAHISFPAAQRLGRLTGRLAFRCAKRHRGICDYQLRMAMPELDEAQRLNITAQCFQHMGMTAWEALARPRLRRDPSRWIRLEEEALLRDAVALGRGVIMVTGHMGNWELMSVVFEMLQLRGRGMVRGLANSSVSEIINEHRNSDYFESIERGSSDSPRQMLKCLNAGEILLVAIDQDIDTRGVFVDFFGIPANTSRMVASLALKRSVPVVTAFGVREPDGRHLFRFQRIDPPQGAQSGAQGEQELTQIISDATEAHIRRYPEHWAWHHRRWKRRPEEARNAPENPRAP